jgi:hypothetical protein
VAQKPAGSAPTGLSVWLNGDSKPLIVQPSLQNGVWTVQAKQGLVESTLGAVCVISSAPVLFARENFGTPFHSQDQELLVPLGSHSATYWQVADGATKVPANGANSVVSLPTTFGSLRPTGLLLGLILALMAVLGYRFAGPAFGRQAVTAVVSAWAAMVLISHLLPLMSSSLDHYGSSTSYPLAVVVLLAAVIAVGVPVASIFFSRFVVALVGKGFVRRSFFADLRTQPTLFVVLGKCGCAVAAVLASLALLDMLWLVLSAAFPGVAL